MKRYTNKELATMKRNTKTLIKKNPNNKELRVMLNLISMISTQKKIILKQEREIKDAEHSLILIKNDLIKIRRKLK